MDPARIAPLAAEFAPLERRRAQGESLSVLEHERWGELRDLLAYEFGVNPPIGATERALRLPTQLKARFGDAGEHTGEVLNLAEGGAFVATGQPLTAGTDFELQIDSGHASLPLALDACAVWQRELSNLDGAAGFGARFQNLEAEEFSALHTLLERRLAELTSKS